MKTRAGALLLLALSTPSAFAEWTNIGTTEKDNTTFFVDYKSIRHIGGFVRMSVLRNLGKPLDDHGTTYSSIVSLEEFDCEEGRWRTVDRTVFTLQNGKGEAQTIGETSDWNYAPAGTFAESLLRIACKK